MSNKTAIEWTDATWNPTVGCDQISPGCAHCYAKTLHDKRHQAFLAGKKMAPQYAQPFEVLQVKDDRLAAPLRWRQPRRVFVNSVSDLFHESVPDAFIDRVFAVMALAPQHTFQLLTKRAERMRAYVSSCCREGFSAAAGPVPEETFTDRINGGIAQHAGMPPWKFRAMWPLPNVWLGVSVENQHFADERIPLLLDTPAAIRFISAEPLLGPIDLFAFLKGDVRDDCLAILSRIDRMDKSTAGLDWVIVGGESGPGARPFAEEWARSIVGQCRSAGVACFVKQFGSNPHSLYVTDRRGVYIGGAGGPKRDRKGGDMAEWPEDLRVREFPEASQ